MLSMIFVVLYITYLCIVNYNLHQLKNEVSLQNNEISLNDSIIHNKENDIMIIEYEPEYGIKYTILNLNDYQKQNKNIYEYDPTFWAYPEFM